MIISPPFLPSLVGTADDGWLDEAMNPAPGGGAFPLTNNLGWHGGSHLQGCGDNIARAISDGTVIYVRQASARNDNADDPLNYHAGASVGGWTSDGCVVLRHVSEVGEGPNGKVSYYSIYMHLEEISSSITKDKVVYRKDPLGRAGYIYGKPNQIHLEIICDDANLRNLMGRNSGEVVTSSDGRTDVLYGDIYFSVPIGTEIHEAVPVSSGSTVAAQSGSPYITKDLLFVGVKYAGHAWITTYTANGNAIDSPIQEQNFEYNLYKTASGLSTTCISAAFELLRFGRIIGPDALAPTNTPHWRQIKYPGGQGWINLASTGIRKFSDADYPHWRGWMITDDSSAPDNRLRSTVIRQWLDANGDGELDANEVHEYLNSPSVKAKLKKVVCKFATEWRAATIAQRWGWLKTSTKENPEKLSEEDFEALKRHIEKLCFWDSANIEIDSVHWHFDPREFIRHLRHCGWLSTHELVQCIPRNAIEQTKNANNQVVYPRSIFSWSQAQQRAARLKVPLNRALRKYLISMSVQRISYFFANCIQETMYLSRTAELGGPTLSYAPWFGRGILQLTWEGNYLLYGKFRGWGQQNPSHYRDQLETDLETACDSGGFYWVTAAKPIPSLICINKEADVSPVLVPSTLNSVCNSYNYATKTCSVASASIPYFNCTQLERVARAVNTGNPGSTGVVNGLVPRSIVFAYALSVLTEMDLTSLHLTPQRPT